MVSRWRSIFLLRDCRPRDATYNPTHEPAFPPLPCAGAAGRRAVYHRHSRRRRADRARYAQAAYRRVHRLPRRAWRGHARERFLPAPGGQAGRLPGAADPQFPGWPAQVRADGIHRAWSDAGLHARDRRLLRCAAGALPALAGAPGHRRDPAPRPGAGDRGRPGAQGPRLCRLPRRAADRRPAGHSRPGRPALRLHQRPAGRMAYPHARNGGARLHGHRRQPPERCGHHRSLGLAVHPRGARRCPRAAARFGDAAAGLRRPRREGGDAMKWLLRGFLALLVLAIITVAWWLFARHHAALPPARTTAAKLQDPALIARGEYLATVGDCAACHTAQGGKPYAGGRALPTPFGDVPAPNLTPDDATGLGQWSFDAFWRALHEGVGRDGHALYPAFPYTSYTRVSRQDAFALFAYLRSLPPVRNRTATPSLRFPYDLRASLTTWRTLYFRPGQFVPDPKQSAAWNRGAYLAQGLGHCNECHVSRDNLGGLPRNETLTGGQIPAQNWYAPDLRTHAQEGKSA